ncbi:MAG: DEAD/DEAH box helicase [Flavobacteriales bacterium]|nr:DEAD/DEAH box helicase [Flavobacteriales bacterium]
MTTFHSLGLQPEILQAVEKLGFEKPTPIQEKSIPYLLENTGDLMALASTGTGKTAAFGLPVLQKINPAAKKIEALVLCPTRELCRQIHDDFQNFACNLNGFRQVAVYGGANIMSQIKELKSGAAVVVGTPGRVVDLIERKNLDISNVKYLVLDEADEMLNMGFKDDLDFILSNTPEERQTMLFSATMPAEVNRIAKRYMNNPEMLETSLANKSAENIEHSIYMVNASIRFDALRRIVDVNPDIYGIVFCRTRKETQQVADNLIKAGYNADSLHGDLSQAQRDSVMAKFRSRHLQILVATDVAARGLDVNDITHVINYNLPDELETYIHRSGRTARAGKKGESIALVTSRDKSSIKILERKIGKQFEIKRIPTGEEICDRQLIKLVDDLAESNVDATEVERYLPIITQKLENFSRDELITRFFATEFTRFSAFYKNAQDINLATSERRSREKEDRNDRYVRDDEGSKRGKKERNRGRGGRVDFDRFFVSLGKKDNLNPHRLMGFINEFPNLQGIAIGRVEIMKSFSFVEVDSNFSSTLVNTVNGQKFHGKPCVIEPASSIKPKKDRDRDRGRDRDRDRKRKR